ncbi:MAG TPA: DUF58 domain-containing protein [Mycobacteriales bacterium]|nr:DUF58 domain-containing protein [Mycobacteriales bacterium]
MSQQSGTAYVVTARAGTAAGLALLMLTLLWLTGNAWFLLLAGAIAGALVVAVASRARLDGLTVEVVHPPRVAVGDTLHTVLTVTNAGLRTSSECSLCVHTAGMADLVAAVGALRPGDRVTLPVPRLGTSRAVADGTLVHLVARPGLGTLAGTRPVHVPDQVTVHPRLHDLPELPVGWTDIDGTDDSVVAGQGSEVLGVRQWRAGDDLRRIHWRSTARTGRPTLVERGEPRTTHLQVMLVGSAEYPGFEDAVSAAASACDLALRRGTTVTAVAWRVDGPVTAPTGSRWELLDWWSGLGGTMFPDPAVVGSAAHGGLARGEWLVAGPVEVLDEWLAPARRAGSGLVLDRLQGSR